MRSYLVIANACIRLRRNISSIEISSMECKGMLVLARDNMLLLIKWEGYYSK
jgi:hypothetical protein